MRIACLLRLALVAVAAGSSAQKPPSPPPTEEQEAEEAPSSEEPQQTPEQPGEVEKPPPAPPDGILPVTEVRRFDYLPRDRPRVLLHNGLLVVVTESGIIEAHEATTGEFAWKLGLPGEVVRTPVILRPSPLELLLATKGGRVIVLDGHEGTIRRETELGFELALAPLPGPEGTVLLATPTGDVVSYHLSTGEKRFRTSTGETPLALSRSTELLVISGGGQTLTGLNLRDGTVRFRFRGRAAFHAPAAFGLDGERIYVGDDAGEFYGLGARDGKVKFRWSTGAAIRSPALVEGDRVYVTTFGNTLFAYAAGNGHEQWRSNLPGRPASGAIRVYQRLLVATFDGMLIEIHPGRGQHGRSYMAPGETLEGPSLWLVPPPSESGEEEEGEKESEGEETEEDLPEKEPPWYERSRLAIALRTGEVLLMKHKAPQPETEEEPREESEEPGKPPAPEPP